MGTTQEASTATSGTASVLAAPRRCPGMMKEGNQSETMAAARFPSSASRGRCWAVVRGSSSQYGTPRARMAPPSSSSPWRTKACSRSEACG